MKPIVTVQHSRGLNYRAAVGFILPVSKPNRNCANASQISPKKYLLVFNIVYLKNMSLDLIENPECFERKVGL